MTLPLNVHHYHSNQQYWKMLKEFLQDTDIFLSFVRRKPIVGIKTSIVLCPNKEIF
jgi:hypothetical protein